MKINENIALLTDKILLVPYCQHHVEKYHDWMQDEELQKATASDPLSIDDEFRMQESWREDGDKLTFIACLPPDKTPDGKEDMEQGRIPDATDKMIGDVNVFLVDNEDPEKSNSVIGEVEIMIAEKGLRGKGYGRAVLVAFLCWVFENLTSILKEYGRSVKAEERLNMEYLRVKINQGNARSIKLFESVGFTKISEEANYFGELELRLEGMENAGKVFADMCSISKRDHKSRSREA